MIELIIPKSVIDIVVNKYTKLYNQRRRKLGRAYPRAILIMNIESALSCNGEFIEALSIKEPIVSRWASNKWKVYHYGHWYYAVKICLSPDGDAIAVAQDALYEGDYHNDIMQTRPYNESIQIKKIRIKESDLRRIVREALHHLMCG